MLRFFAGAGSALLLVAAGFFIWRAWPQARTRSGPRRADADRAAGADARLRPAQPPSADERTREQRRFDRADRDNDGRITLEEMTLSAPPRLPAARHQPRRPAVASRNGRCAPDQIRDADATATARSTAPNSPPPRRAPAAPRGRIAIATHRAARPSEAVSNAVAHAVPAEAARLPGFAGLSGSR